MEEVKSYNFSEKEFKKVAKLADDVHNTIVVLKGFCENEPYSPDFMHIKPVVDFLHEESDKLTTIFIAYPEK